MARYYEVPRTFQEWRRFARYSIDDCVMVFKVNKRTVLNWEFGKTKAPQSVLICLQLFAGRLDFLGKPWRGFRIMPDCIESPDGDYVRPWEISALRYAMQALDMHRRIREDADIKPENVTYICDAKKKDQKSSIKNNVQDIDNKELA